MTEYTPEQIQDAVNAVMLAYRNSENPANALTETLGLSVKYENTDPGTYLAEFPGGTFPAHVSPDGHFYAWTDQGANSYGKDPRDWPKRVPAVVVPKATDSELSREDVERLWASYRTSYGLGNFDDLDGGYGEGTAESIVNTVNAARRHSSADVYEVGSIYYTPEEGSIEVIVPPEVAKQAQKTDQVYLTIKDAK